MAKTGTTVNLGLRQLALSEGKESECKGICTLVVDIPVIRGVITFVLRRTGECSIYLPQRGGFIGCHAYPKVMQAVAVAFAIVDDLNTFQFDVKMDPASCVIPTASVNVEFWFVSSKAILHKTETRATCFDILHSESKLFPLFSVLNYILTVIREAEESNVAK